MPTPSLIIPSAPVYDEGLLYGLNVYGTNFVPEPIPFTRATTATRTNAAGLIELAPYNLVQYSEQFDNAAWTKSNAGTGVLPLVVANQGTAPDGTLTADRIQLNRGSGGTVSDSSVVRQQITVANNATTTISIYLKSFDGNNYQIVFSNSGVVVSQKITVTNQWQRFLLTGVSAGAAANIEIQLREGVFSITGQSVTADLLVWGAQLVEGTEALPYQQTITRLNRPRVDFSLGGCPNLLLEPQRTNLALQSSSFDSASWGKSNTTATGNTTISPSGIVDADTYTANGSSSVKQIFITLLLSASTNYTLSIYAKKDTNNFIQFLSSSNAFGGGFYANFDLQNGVIGQYAGTLSVPKITDVGDGWYRCEASVVSVASPISGAAMSISLITSATSPRAETNTLSTSVFLWGAQLEAGAYATSYIPTTSASVTRNADSFTESNVFSRGMITDAGGTWFVELRNNVSLTRDAAGSNGMYLSGGNGFNNDGFLIWNWNITTPLQITKYVSNSFTVLHTLPVGTCKVAIKWNGSTADIFVNGVKVIASTVFTGTAMQNLFGTGASIPFNIQQMALYPTPLSDSELISMTTL